MDTRHDPRPHIAPSAALFEQIEAAATDESAWSVVLAEICAVCQGHKAMVFWVEVDPAGRDWRGPMWGHLHGYDPEEAAMSREIGTGPYMEHIHRIPRDGAYTGDMLLSNEDYWQTSYYRTHGRRFGFGQTLGQVLGSESPLDFAQIVVVRHRDDPLFGPAELDFMRVIAPHVGRSARIARSRFDRQKEIERWRIIDDERQSGHFVVAEHGEVLHANQAARDLLGPYPVKARLADGRRLGAALESITGVTSLVIVGHDGETIDAEARPLSRTFGAERRPSVSVTFRHPDAPRYSSEHLRARWGLTPAEVALAMDLLDSVTPDAHSQARGVSLTTTRSHLKALRAKLGARSTAQAVAILARG